MVVISLGGSIVAPDGIDVAFVRGFREVLARFAATGGRAIIVVGGGGVARRYQDALREIAAATATHERLDWVGVAATRLNAELVRHAMGELVRDPVVTDPTGAIVYRGKVLLAAGWKPGFSTDYDAVVLAERFGAETVVNLSNIAHVYDADPRRDPSAQPIERMTWPEFQRLVGEDWAPGSNWPFDPVATKHAAKIGLRVVVAAGRDLANIEAILRGDPFVGTRIVP